MSPRSEHGDRHACLPEAARTSSHGRRALRRDARARRCVLGTRRSVFRVSRLRFLHFAGSLRLVCGQRDLPLRLVRRAERRDLRDVRVVLRAVELPVRGDLFGRSGLSGRCVRLFGSERRAVRGGLHHRAERPRKLWSLRSIVPARGVLFGRDVSVSVRDRDVRWPLRRSTVRPEQLWCLWRGLSERSALCRRTLWVRQHQRHLPRGTVLPARSMRLVPGTGCDVPAGSMR